MKKWLCGALFAVLLLSACQYSVQPESRSAALAEIQFAEYHFPDYREKQANQVGIDLVLYGICAIDQNTLFLFGKIAIVGSEMRL